MMRKINSETMIEEIQNIKEDILVNGNGNEYLVIVKKAMKAKIDLETFEIVAKIKRFANDIAEAEIETLNGSILKKDGKWKVKIENKVNSLAQELNQMMFILLEYKEIEIIFENLEVEIKNSKIVRLHFEFDEGAIYSFNKIEEINVSETSFEILDRVSRKVSGTAEQAQKQLEKEKALSYTEPLMVFRETLIQKLIMERNRCFQNLKFIKKDRLLYACFFVIIGTTLFFK